MRIVAVYSPKLIQEKEDAVSDGSHNATTGRPKSNAHACTAKIVHVAVWKVAIRDFPR